MCNRISGGSVEPVKRLLSSGIVVTCVCNDTIAILVNEASKLSVEEFCSVDTPFDSVNDDEVCRFVPLSEEECDDKVKEVLGVFERVETVAPVDTPTPSFTCSAGRLRVGIVVQSLSIRELAASSLALRRSTSCSCESDETETS